MQAIQGSYSEFLGMPETRIEFIKGWIKYMSPTPSIRHQDLIGNLYVRIRSFFSSFNEKKYKLVFAPVEVCLFEGSYEKEKVEAALQPDLIIVCDRSKLDGNRCYGAPDFVAEVLSPSSIKRDVQEKFDLYEKYGVREYWIISPLENYVTVHILQTDGKFDKGTIYEVEQDSKSVIPVSIIPGLEISINDLYEEQ